MTADRERYIQQLEAEVIALARCASSIVRDLRDAGHDEMAERFLRRCGEAMYAVRELQAELAAIPGQLARAAERIAELEGAVPCPACGGLDRGRAPICPYCHGEGTRVAYHRAQGSPAGGAG